MDRTALDAERTALLTAFEGFPAGVARACRMAEGRAVPAGEWTPGLVVRHLIAVEADVHQARLRDLETTEDPRWSWMEPGPWPGEPDLPLDALLARFADLRAVTTAHVDALDAAGWRRTGTHERLGVWDVAGLIANAVTHDADHLRGLS